MEINVLNLFCTILIVGYLHDMKQKILKLCWPEPCWTAKTKHHFRLTQHLKTGIYWAWVSNVCGEKEMAKGWSKCCRWLPVGHSERTRDNMHKLSQGNTEWDIKKKLNCKNNRRIQSLHPWIPSKLDPIRHKTPKLILNIALLWAGAWIRTFQSYFFPTH